MHAKFREILIPGLTHHFPVGLLIGKFSLEKKNNCLRLAGNRCSDESGLGKIWMVPVELSEHKNVFIITVVNHGSCKLLQVIFQCQTPTHVGVNMWLIVHLQLNGLGQNRYKCISCPKSCHFLFLTVLSFFLFSLFLQGWYIVTYALGIYQLNLFIAFLTPKIDPALEELGESDIGVFLPLLLLYSCQLTNFA